MSKLSLFACGVAAGAFFMPIIGFAGFGWKFDSKARAMADEAATAGVHNVLVPVCVARFNADPEVSTHRAAMKAMQYFHPRMEYVEKGGWAKLQGQKQASPGVARACAEALKIAS
jgi:hypothetical protein